MDPGAQRKFHNLLLALIFFVLGLIVWFSMVRPSSNEVSDFFTALSPLAKEPITARDWDEASRFSYPSETVVLLRSNQPPVDVRFVQLPPQMLVPGGAITRRPPDVWKRISRAIDHELDDFTPVPLLHRMKTPSGSDRLVCVELIVRFTGPGISRPTGEFYAAAYSIARTSDASSPIIATLAGPIRCTRVMAAAIRENTPTESRFVIPYELDQDDSSKPAEKGEIIGQLGDDGTVTLTHGLSGARY